MIGEALALSCALSWSVSILLFRRSEAVGPLSINVFKNVVASILMALTLWGVGGGIDWNRTPEDWLRLIASGVIGIAIADTIFLTALRRLGPSRLAVVDTAYAPLVVLFSVLMLGEELGIMFLVGGVLVLVGVLLAGYAPAGDVADSEKGGVAIALLALVLMAFAIVLSKPALESGELIEVTLIRLVSGVAGQMVWFAIRPSDRSALRVFVPQRLWVTLLPGAVLGGWLSMILWLGGYQLTLASTAAVLNQMTTVFTIALAWFFLKEKLSSRGVVGSVVALSGVVLILAT